MNCTPSPQSHQVLYETDNLEFVRDAQRRIEKLREAISWSFQNGGLSSGQRTCLHQEIASWLRDIDAVIYGFNLRDCYRIPPRLEEKVQHILKVIENTGWKKQEIIKY